MKIANVAGIILRLPEREASAEILRFAQDDNRRKNRPEESGW
jgi:hypothetical protein